MDRAKTFVLRRKFGAKTVSLYMLLELRRNGVSFPDSIRARQDLKQKDVAVISVPECDSPFTFIKNLEALGIWARRYGGIWPKHYPVKFSDWKIGMEFWVGSGSEFPYRVTDVGTRTIIAIHLDKPDDPSWYHGPPYAVEEIVFDENDLQICYLERPIDGEE